MAKKTVKTKPMTARQREAVIKLAAKLNDQLGKLIAMRAA